MTHFPLTPMPVRFAHGPPPITSLSFIASTTSSRSQNITLPASINAGDLLIYCDHGFQILTQGGPLPSVTPSGFTLLKDESGFGGTGGRRAVYSARIADGSEDSSVVAGMVNTGGTTTAHFALCKTVLQFRADRSLTAFSAGQGSDIDGSSNISAGSMSSTITSVSMTKPSLIIGWTMGNQTNPTLHLEDSTVPVEDGTQVFDDTAAAVCKVKMGHYFRQSIPVNIAVVASAGGTQHWTGGFYVELE